MYNLHRCLRHQLHWQLLVPRLMQQLVVPLILIKFYSFILSFYQNQTYGAGVTADVFPSQSFPGTACKLQYKSVVYGAAFSIKPAGTAKLIADFVATLV